MIEIRKRLFIGDEDDCRYGDDDWGVVHACKHPCHQRAVGYRGKLSSTHPYYLVFERENDLFLNMIDPPRPIFMPQTFTSFLEFTSTQWEAGKNILIHCNEGESRAPTLALIFMAKHLKELPDSSYLEAREEFEKLYPAYRPGNGIQIYLTGNWNDF
jgi:hypothetical protein